MRHLNGVCASLDDIDWEKAKAPNGCFNSSGAFWCEDKAKGFVTVTMPAKRMQYLYAKIDGHSGFYVNYCKDLITLPTKTDKQAAAALNKGDYEKFHAYLTEAMMTGDFTWTCMGERKIKSVFCLGNKDWSGNYYIKISKYDEYGILDSEKETSTPEKDYCKKLLDAVE